MKETETSHGRDGHATGEWTIDLVNDKGERKATGSYYTPDYIVKFIVEHTVGPALNEAVAGKTTDAELLHAVLTVNVLDPAMGSGHFLVEATEYIARYLVDLAITPEGKTAEEADLAYWKRRVAQSCVYGVDLNPLAVELAKLSLWLITVAKDRPLSFLDHHLRPGNSLVGASLSTLQQHSTATVKAVRKKRGTGVPPVKATETIHGRDGHATDEQFTLFNDAEFAGKMSVAVNNMWRIEESEAVSVEQVKEQEQLYANLRRDLIGKYGKLANLLTAQYFNVTVPNDQWAMVVDQVMGRSLGLPPALQTILQQAEEIATRERFFHWELEFPELYFDRYGRPLGEEGGFEAVIGNPPYVRQEQLAVYKPYFQSKYAEVYQGTADLFVYFYVQGLRQLQKDKRLSYISSNMWLRASYGKLLRAHLADNSSINCIVDFGDLPVFESATTYPMIIVIQKNAPQTTIEFTRVKSLNEIQSGLNHYITDYAIELPNNALQGGNWCLIENTLAKIMRKMEYDSIRLSDYVSGKINYGIKTGCNEAFIIDDKKRAELIKRDSNSSEIIKKLVVGSNIRKWYYEEEDRWLIFTRRGINIDNYPAIKEHLSTYHDRLLPCPTTWDSTKIWPGRKPGNYAWYEIQDSVDYYKEFESPKIMYQEIATYQSFTFDVNSAYVNNKIFIISVNDPYLLGILNSNAAWRYLQETCSLLSGGALAMQTPYLSKLPIPKVVSDDRVAIGTIAMQITSIVNTRYAVQRQVRHRLLTDFGTPGKKLNQKLNAWWTLDFPALRAELQKVFKRDIPVKERNDWEEWHIAQCTEHIRLTGEIVSLETELNARVYALFKLTDDEIALIEKSTKYRYGEV